MQRNITPVIIATDFAQLFCFSQLDNRPLADTGAEAGTTPLHFPPFPFNSPSFAPPYFFLTLFSPDPSTPLLFHPFPLYLNPARGSRECCMLPSGVRGTALPANAFLVILIPENMPDDNRYLVLFSCWCFAGEGPSAAVDRLDENHGRITPPPPGSGTVQTDFF